MYTIYLVKNLNSDYYKIGFTKRKVIQRINELKIGNPDKLKIIHTYYSHWGKRLEKVLHRKYEIYKVYDISKEEHTEWFQLPDKEIDKFLEVCEMTSKNLDLVKDFL